MEEDFRCHESLVTDINLESLLCDRVQRTVNLYPFGRIIIIFVKFFYNVRANVTEFLLKTAKIMT